MGSTKKVGESVRGGRVPEEYDSSPTLYRRNSVPPWTGRGKKRYGGTNTLQVKTRICARDLVPDEVLYFNVVLRHKVDRVFLLADASRARRTLDRVRAFEYERSRFTREVGRESEDFLEFCWSERTSHGLGGLGQG
jgi:hypothetical protein